jgi:hypothetical protein
MGWTTGSSTKSSAGALRCRAGEFGDHVAQRVELLLPRQLAMRPAGILLLCTRTTFSQKLGFENQVWGFVHVNMYVFGLLVYEFWLQFRMIKRQRDRKTQTFRNDFFLIISNPMWNKK